MKKIKIALLGVVVFVLLFLGGASFLPSTWVVERSIVIHAPPSAIYPLIANFKSGWIRWSSFDVEDATIQYVYSGPDQGTGATRTWVSEKMGNGTQRIIRADILTGVEFELEMTDYGTQVNGALVLLPDSEGTRVAWKDWGNWGWRPLYRYMGIFMDKMMGPEFEKSLATLKKLAEESR